MSVPTGRMDVPGFASRHPSKRSPNVSGRTRLCLLTMLLAGLLHGYSTARAQTTSDAASTPAAAEFEAVQNSQSGDLIYRKNPDGTWQAVPVGELKLPSRPVFDLLLKYAVSEDGALHAEKYYRTVTEEFASTRPAFRWRQLVALARVTASEYGYPAPGLLQARELLGIS